MDSRQQFEEWAWSTFQEQFWWDLEQSQVFKHCGDTYMTEFLRVRWEGWQASRESMVVELPTIDNKDWACSSDECEYIRQGITLTKRKINATGIRTK